MADFPSWGCVVRGLRSKKRVSTIAKTLAPLTRRFIGRRRPSREESSTRQQGYWCSRIKHDGSVPRPVCKGPSGEALALEPFTPRARARLPP
ncbi:hypothetical protein ON010_g13585 [Phytophthora cinnamomi]|nr:hypothetical protein ON010_g13585 [Phytophthora cinnamomi]